MQIQNDTISVAKAALNPVKANIMPQRQRQKKKPVSYSQLARSIHELAATLDQKSSQKQLVNHVFPKLAVYNSVDPSLAPSLLMVCVTGYSFDDQIVSDQVQFLVSFFITL
jgi:hypothetical protein